MTLRREHHIWRKVSDELALRYVCFERLGIGDWAVQQCDFVRSTGETHLADWATVEKYRVENAVEIELTLWFASPEEAIKHHDAKFDNDWTSDSNE